MNVKELINYGKETLKENEIDDYSIVAKTLAKFILKMEDSELIVNDTKQVSAEQEEYYKLELIEIVNGKPIQYITNKQEFYGLEFYVDENVLIPQPDTEILVEETIDICSKFNNNNKVRVLDMCTGSGCIGIALKNRFNNSSVTMVDVYDNVLDVARKNANTILGDLSDVKFIESDMFEEIEEEYDIIVSNPPYIKEEDIEQLDDQVKHEPFVALYGDVDGLIFYKVLISEAHKYLSDDGYLCMEIGYDQRKDVEELLEKNGNYKNIYSKKDLSGNDRIVIAQRA